MTCARVVILILLTACKFPELPPLDEIDAADGGSDGVIDPVDAMQCEGVRYGFAISNIAACDVPEAVGPLDLTGVASIDTFAGTMTSLGGSTAALPSTALVMQTDGPMIRVVAVTSLAVPASATTSIAGEYPLAFLVRGDATIDGTLTLTGSAFQTSGPAGRRTGCGAGSGSPGTGAGNGGGGGGGGLGGAGGVGGHGNDDIATAGAAGVALALPARTPLWGGCPGSPGNSGTIQGAGGGAVQISVQGSLTVDGTIATGGGGGNGGVGAGGGGGGSGGMVLLEAGTRIDGIGFLTANGGAGGGGGGGSGTATAGAAGCLRCANPGVGGGSSGSGSGYGGSGAAGGTAAAAGTGGSMYSGGGGGGGVGLVWLRAPAINVSGLVSPTPRTSSL